MKRLLATTLALGLLGAAPGFAQSDHPAQPRLLELTEQLADAADDIKNEHLGMMDRARNVWDDAVGGRENVFVRFDEAAEELLDAAQELDSNALKDMVNLDDSREEKERRFIRSFRRVERLARETETHVTRRKARRLWVQDVRPTLVDIRATLPELSAYRDDRGRGRRFERL